MNAKINFQMLKTVRHSSGALGPLGMVIHPFTEPGVYHVGVHHHGRTAAETLFRVDAAGPLQLDIDLAAMAARNTGAGDCACKASAEDAPMVSPKGYVLFHASTGDGYSATVANAQQKVVFDTSKLAPGDLYATSLLEPGRYTMTNTLTGAKGEVVVSLTADEAKRIKTLEPQYVDVSAKKLEPAKLRLVVSQGLIFRAKDGARIVVARDGQPGPRHSDKPLMRWTRLAPATPARAKTQR